jgi:glycosyltransferase involved in cell wall biosynthesis
MDERMRIAILAPHAGYIVGGLETAAKGLRKNLLARNECDIFSLAETDWTTKVPGIREFPSATLVNRLKLGYINYLIPYLYIIKRHAVSEFSYSYHLLPLLRRYSPDIIINFNFSILALFCKYYRYKYKVPFINVGQAGCVYMEAESARTKPDAYVALTPVCKEYIQRRIRGVRVVVIPNGVDLSLFSAKGPEFPLEKFRWKSGRTHLELNRPFILSTSRLVKEKRLNLLLEAFSKLEKGTLILAGHGEQKKRLLDLGQRLLIEDRLIILDTLSQEQLSRLYRSCDVFSLPSKNEAFGNVIIEAMASGLPVVATDDRGFEWIVGKEGGILVDVTDAQAYAEALLEAHERDFQDGPQRRAERFSWSRVAQEYQELIEGIVREKKSE